LRGRPPRDHTRTLDAIFWFARTGAPGSDLAEELGNWNSVHREYGRWTKSGLWDLVLEALADGCGNDAPQRSCPKPWCSNGVLSSVGCSLRLPWAAS
jgi:transposase